MTILLLEVPELILLLVSSRPLHIRKTLPQVHKNIERIVGSSQIKKKQKTRRERSYCQTYWNITVPSLGISVLSYMCIGSLLPISFFLFLTVSISSWLSFSLSYSSSVIFPLYCSPHFLVLFLRSELFAMQQYFFSGFFKSYMYPQTEKSIWLRRQIIDTHYFCIWSRLWW